MGNNNIKKVVGCILRTISVLLFVLLFIGFTGTLKDKETYIDGIPGFIGRMLATLIILGSVFWFNLFLYKYSGELIRYNQNKK